MSSWNDLIGIEHAKRAIEVALAGKHSIRFVGAVSSQADNCRRYCVGQSLAAEHREPCACGWHGDPVRECTCSTDMIAKRQRALRYWSHRWDITVEIPTVDWHHVEGWIVGKRGESEESMLRRIDEMANHKSLLLNEASTALLKAAFRQLGLTIGQVRSILGVARTIANLSQEKKIRAAHLAEAIQYQPSRQA